jgi:glutamyl-tRNA reductase
VPRPDRAATVFLVDASKATTGDREGGRAGLPESSVNPLVKALRSAGAIEAAVLATSDRTECYVVSAGAEAARSLVADALGRVLGTDAATIAPALAVSQGEAAARHLLRLAGGLESPLPGDGQLRHAYEAAHAARASGPLVRRVFQAALAVGDHARTLVASVAPDRIEAATSADAVDLTIEAELARLDEWRVRRDAFSMIVA